MMKHKNNKKTRRRAIAKMLLGAMKTPGWKSLSPEHRAMIKKFAKGE
jgi:hypothetical protein